MRRRLRQALLGLDTSLRKDFSFLSCGIAGELKASATSRHLSPLRPGWRPRRLPSEKRYVVFKRWDALDEGDEPEVVVFFAIPDVLSGLFTWAGFDEPMAEAVAAPLRRLRLHHPVPTPGGRQGATGAIFGMFDVSARPRVPDGVLTFAVPWSKFERMLANRHNFLTTESGRRSGAGSPGRRAQRSSRRATRAADPAHPRRCPRHTVTRY